MMRRFLCAAALVLTGSVMACGGPQPPTIEATAITFGDLVTHLKSRGTMVRQASGLDFHVKSCSWIDGRLSMVLDTTNPWPEAVKVTFGAQAARGGTAASWGAFDARVPSGESVISMVSDGHEASRGFRDAVPLQRDGEVECVAQVEDVSPSRFRKVARWDAFGRS